MAEEKRGRKRKYDELKIMELTYRLRGLTVNQLTLLFFDNKHNAYKKIKEMEGRGLFGSMRHVEGGRYQNKFVFVTDNAINLLDAAGRITTRKRLSRHNKPSPEQLHYVIHINNMLSYLHKEGFEVFDSREWKERYNMDRTSFVRGGVKLKDGQAYALYMFIAPAVSDEKGKEYVLSERTIQEFLREKKMYMQTNKMICITANQKIYNQLLKHASVVKSMTIHEEFCLLPGGGAFAQDILTLKHSNEERKWQIKMLLGGIVSDLATEKRYELPFASYLWTDWKEEFYIVDLLYMNFASIQQIRKYYSRCDKKIKIICWQPLTQELKTEFEAYSNVEVIAVGRDFVEWCKQVRLKREIDS